MLTVTDPEHKNVSVDVLRGVTADASVLPNEGRRKVYIFPDCSLLDGKAQNVLLKVVEDGPVHAAFLGLPRNGQRLLLVHISFPLPAPRGGCKIKSILSQHAAGNQQKLKKRI